jgi:hypothetical protein
MEGVTAMVEKGLSLLRDHYASMFQRVGGPNVNVAALKAARMTLPFRWDDLTSMLTFESMSLAHDRYQVWYERANTEARRTGVKRAAAVEFDELPPAMRTRSSTRTRASRATRSSLGRGGGLPRRGR